MEDQKEISSKEDRDPKEICKNSESIINLYETNSETFDKINEPGAIQFKCLLVDIYQMFLQLPTEIEEKTKYNNKYLEFITKFLNNEIEEVGIKAIKTFFLMRNNKESYEYQIKTYSELLKFTNKNYPRINEIFKINLKNESKTPLLSMNSIDILNNCNYYIITSFNYFYSLLTSKKNSSDVEILKNQIGNLDKNVRIIYSHVKDINLKELKTNYHFFILEKYLLFLSQILNIFEKFHYNRQINKDKIETIYNMIFYILSNSNSCVTLKITIRNTEDLFRFNQPQQQQGQQHQQTNSNSITFYDYIFQQRGKFLRLEEYTKNPNTLDLKYNEIFKFILRIYFIILCKFDSKNLIKDLEYLISKLNDSKINLDLKNNILSFICNVYKQIFSHENSGNFIKISEYILEQITSFYQTLFSLSSESIGEYLKEEKQQQKEILSKNMLNAKLDENDTNKFKKNNVYHLFSILLSNDYDKYILLDDPKNDFVSNTLNVIRECISLIKKEIDGPKIKKYDIKEKNKESEMDMLEKKNISLNKIAVYLYKFFYYFFHIYEKSKVNHQTHDTQSMGLLDEIIKIYLNNLPFDLFVMVFTKLMPYILRLYKLGCKICQTKNCISLKLVHNIFKPKDAIPSKVVNTLYEIYFEFFSFKTFEVGNPNEIFNAEINSPPTISLHNTINIISILKSIFFNLLDCISNFNYFKSRVLPLIIDYLCLSKKSEYYGNYIYILRCFFKYLKSAIQNIQNLPQADKINKLNFSTNLNNEINYILYAIIKYLINVKQNYSFLNETIIEIIMIIPIKMKFLQEIPQLIIPSLVDSLTLNTENINLYLANLENWMSAIYVKHPENVIPYIQKDLTKITNLLSQNLYKPLNMNSCLTSLKCLSKISGKGRNYMEIRKIEHKICPPLVFSIILYEKNTNRKMNLILETIIDICNMNSRNKFLYSKKTNSNSFNALIQTFQNYISIYKNCLSAFFAEKIDYDYLIEMKKDILNGNYDFSNKEYDVDNSFKKMNDKNSKIKVNNIYRKAEHYLFEKILGGFFSSYSTLTSYTSQPITLSYNITQIGDENGNFIKFLADNFVLMLLSKNNNNKNMLLFEFDPIIILDDIIFFIFSNTPTILRNTNIMISELSIKILNQIMDSINNFFDNDANVIKNLEIIDIIYLKFFNYCYINEPLKKDIGFTLLKILLTKFDKIINFKYLKYIFRCISSITSNYSNLIIIKFKKGCNKLVEVIEDLTKMFLISNEDYYKLTPEMFKEDENISMENEEIKKAKKDFIMLFEFLKYAFDEIVECFDSPKDYSRNLGLYLYNKILYSFPLIKKIVPVLFQIDVDKITIIEFLQFFLETKTENNYSEIISGININISVTENNENNHYILPNFNEKKIYKKLETTCKTLTKKLGLRDNEFNTLTKSADSLNKMFDFCPIIINEFIFSENSNISDNNKQLITDVVESLYFNILTDYFICVQISNYFKNMDSFKTNYLFLFVEQLLENKSCEFHFKVKNDNNEDIIIDDKVNPEYIKFIEKYVFDKEHKIDFNTNNNRDNVIGEIFELFGQKLNMIQKFLKLLNNIYTNINIQNEKFITYKNKTKEISLLIIFNRRSSIILKEASKIVINAFNKWNLESKDKESLESMINNILKEINIQNIHDSNCGINKDVPEGLQKEKINILLFLCKTKKLNDETKEIIFKKLDCFDNYNEGESQYILFYGYISLFLYIDFKDKNTNEIAFIKIFSLLLKKFKEITIFQSGHITNQQYLYKMGYKNPNNMGNNIDNKKEKEKEIYHLPDFTQSFYSKYIFKYFTKNRKYLTNYLLYKAEKSEYRYISKFVKVLFIDEKNALILEAIFRDFALFAKKLIYTEKNDKFTNNKSNLEKMVYILKICKIIAPQAPLYLLSTDLLEIVNPYVKEAIYNIHIGKIKSTDDKFNDYDKLFKYWNDLNKIYIENFNRKSNYIYSLFYFYSMNGVSENEKNKIILFIMYRLSIIINEKKFKAIINEFLKFNKITFKVFDNLVQYLIIPMTIQYLRNTKFFKFFSNQLNSIFKFYSNLLNNNKKKDEKEPEKHKEKLLYDEKFILNFLEILTHRLTAIKFDTEKKEEMKFRLLSLIILIYNEYVSQNGKEIENDPQIKNIYFNIQYLLSNPQFVEKEAIGLWRIYLLLDICLFEKLDKNEQEIETTFNFYKSVIEDYQDIEALSYEVILPYTENSSTGKLFESYYKEGNYSILRILMILLKFPNIIIKQNEKFFNLILSLIFKYTQNYSKLSLVYRKQLIQIMGIIISFISRQKTLLRKPKQKNDTNPINKINENIPQQNKNLTELELFTYRITYKLYKNAFFNGNDSNIIENFEIIKRLIVYLRELLNSETQLQMMLAVYDNKSKEAYIKHIHAHIQMLRIYMIYIRMDTIYKNLNLYFDLHYILTEGNMNYRYFNDFALVFRLLTDDKLLLKMNVNKERPNENVLYEHKFEMFNRIKEILKTKKKIITFSNEIPIRNYSYDEIGKKIQAYLESNFGNLDNSNINNNQNIRHIQQMQQPTQVSTSENLPTTFQTNIPHQQNIQNNNNIAQQNIQIQNQQNQNVNNVINQGVIQQGNIQNQINNNTGINDKWLSIFPINELKYFIFQKRFVEDIYATINKINSSNNMKNIIPQNNSENNINNNAQVENNYNNLSSYNKLVSIARDNIEIQKNIQTYTHQYYENFYYFTIFFLREYKQKYDYYKKNLTVSFYKEMREYFLTTHNFYYNLRNYEELKYIRDESIDCIYNDKDKNKMYIIFYNILMVYPDAILSAFYFFLDCKEIMEKEYEELLGLLIHTYRHFREKYYDQLLEHLINSVMYNKYLQDKPNVKNKFMYDILSSTEIIYKMSKTNENIVSIFIKYLKNYLTVPAYNKKEIYLMQSLHLIIYNTIRFDLKQRKEIFKILKAYIGNNLIDSLKWIFPINNGDETLNIFSLQYIPFSIDLLLSHFQEGIPLQLNRDNFSKFKDLIRTDKNSENEMIIETNEENNHTNDEYDKTGYIRKMVDNSNLITKRKKIESLLDPIRNIIFPEASNCKIFACSFIQIWKILSMNERESLSLHINEFLYNYVLRMRERIVRNDIIEIISSLIETFSQCSPIIYIKPNIIYSLLQNHNLWSMVIFYLENLLVSGIEISATYYQLINIFSTLQEKDLIQGLKYYFSKTKINQEISSSLQINDYKNAEKLIYNCFAELGKILDNINIENINFNDENSIDPLEIENFEIFNDLSIWETDLIECYENTNKWNNIVEISNNNNDCDLKVKGLWNCGHEKWKELDKFTKAIEQYEKPEKLNSKNPYYIQANEICLNWNKTEEIEDINQRRLNDNKYQNVCFSTVKNIYQDFIRFPKNLENIDFYYFLIFQVILEAWESMNYYSEAIKKLKEKLIVNFKDNLLLWRERLPHYCEGFQTIQCILEPRNYLFNMLKSKILTLSRSEDVNFQQVTDKVWGDTIFLKYSRKLKLYDTFYDYLNILNKEDNCNAKNLPYETFCKDIEHIKFIRNNSYNYELGIKFIDIYINEFTSLKTNRDIIFKSNEELIPYVENVLKSKKAYFLYKKGDILSAHKLFTEASIINGKSITDYHLYYDWADMCEEIAVTIKGNDGVSDWFENTIHNLLYTIIYKLDKAKYIIPRIINLIREFPNENLKNRFNDEIMEIPIWIWIFWLNVLFENFNSLINDDNRNDFYFVILKRIAKQYKQIFYYPFNIYEKNYYNKQNISTNVNKYKELHDILFEDNIYDHSLDKIQLIIDELTKKEKENEINSLNNILNYCEKMTYKNQKLSAVKSLFQNIVQFLDKFPSLSQFKNNIEKLLQNNEATRNQLRECAINNKNYIHNLITTENKFLKFSKLREESLHNTDFSNIELPGYFSNKIIEPTVENIIYISRFESEFTYKLLNDPRSKVFIKASNEKLYNFIIKNDDITNIDMKIYMLQIIFNFIFAKNMKTYKKKVCFNIPIKYHIATSIKIVEEDDFKYNLNEIYEYCLQQRGYDPKISNQIFEEEANKGNVRSDLVYYSSENNEKLFYKMCKIIPQDCLKNFIHRFILNYDDILVFRKQFTASYSINNLFNFILSDNIILKNITFNKETGLCTLNSDLTLFADNEYKEIIEQKEGTPLRLTKNISYFLSIASIYGVIPGIFNSSCEALLQKQKILKNILKICLCPADKFDNDKADKIVQNYVNKFKFVLNIGNDEINKNINNNEGDINNNINNTPLENKKDNDININTIERKEPLKIVYELIDNSMNNENLKKKTIDYDAWF